MALYWRRTSQFLFKEKKFKVRERTMRYELENSPRCASNLSNSPHSSAVKSSPPTTSSSSSFSLHSTLSSASLAKWEKNTIYAREPLACRKVSDNREDLPLLI